jgi:hypothetical protein
LRDPDKSRREGGVWDALTTPDRKILKLVIDALCRM